MTRKQAISLVAAHRASVAMLAVLVWRVPSFDTDEVIPELTTRTVLWLVAAAAPHPGRPSCSRALRWQKVLDALGLHAGLRRLLSHYLAGQFVSNVLPTTIGGDVLRVSRLSRETGESPDSFASVVLERLTGWLVLPIISVVGFLVNPGLQHLGTATRVALGLGLRHAHRPRACSSTWPPPRIGGRFAARDGLAAVRSAPSTSGSTGSATTRARRRHGAARRASPTSSPWCSPRWPPPRRSASATPPASPRCSPSSPPWPSPRCCRSASPGLGVREGAFVLFLGPLGVATEEAIALGLLLYLLNLGVSLLGAPAFAVGRPIRAPQDPLAPPTGCVPAAEPASPSSDDRRRRRADAPPPTRAAAALVARGRLRRRRVRRVLGGPEPVRLGRRRSRARPSGTPRTIIHIERWLHLYFEAHVQSWYLDLPGRGLIRLWNVYYGIAHFLVTLVALMWLFRRDPERYPLWRNTLAFTTCLAVIGFAAYSLMPPRLLDDPGEYGGCQVYAPEAAARASPAVAAPGLRPATATSTPSTGTAGGSRSATRATRTSPTSTPRCRACTSAGPRGARS